MAAKCKLAVLKGDYNPTQAFVKLRVLRSFPNDKYNYRETTRNNRHKMSRNNVRGPTSALTEFLRESGITPTTIARRRATANTDNANQAVAGPSNAAAGRNQDDGEVNGESDGESGVTQQEDQSTSLYLGLCGPSGTHYYSQASGYGSDATWMSPRKKLLHLEHARD